MALGELRLSCVCIAMYKPSLQFVQGLDYEPPFERITDKLTALTLTPSDMRHVHVGISITGISSILGDYKGSTEPYFSMMSNISHFKRICLVRPDLT